MKVIYPPDFVFDEETKRNLPKFCYPCEDYAPPISQHFTFVLTDLESKYRFGHCVYPPGGEQCHCFYSHLPWHDFFYQLLDKLDDIGFNQKDVISPLLDSVYNHSACKTWYKGDLSSVTFQVKCPETSEMEDLVLRIPDPTKLPPLPGNHNLNTFYTNLSHNVLLAILASLIFERRILMTCKSIETLTGCVQGAAMILYPLYWQHIFCPVLPPHLMDYCCAPMPFLIGVHSSLMEKVNRMPLGDVVLIDIDAQTLESCYDDLGEFPEYIVSPLKHTLKKPSSATGETVARAFVGTWAGLIGQYKSAFEIKTKEVEVDGKVEKKKEFVFDPEKFIHIRPEMSELLDHLLHFQHFQQFIAARIASANTDSKVVYRDLFDNELQALEDEWKTNWKNPEVMKRALHKNNMRLREQGKKLGGQIKVGYKKLKKNIGPSQVEDTSGLRHNSESLDLDAIVIKAKMQRPPPKPPKPYAQYKEEKEVPQSLPIMTLEEERQLETVPTGNLLSLTPNHSEDQWKKATDNGLDSSDSDSLISSSSSSDDGGVIILAPPPVPPPRSNRRRMVMNMTHNSQKNEPVDVIGNLPVIKDARLSYTMLANDPKRESLDLSGSLAAALINIDPDTAETLQQSKVNRTCHPPSSMSDLPPPLQPMRSTSQGTPVGTAMTNTCFPPPLSAVSDPNNHGMAGVMVWEQGRCNALSKPQAPSKSNPFLSDGQSERQRSASPFADLLTDEWSLKKPVSTKVGHPKNGN
jgi:hypothetical protein